jgi:hypothetical protein
LFQPIPLVVEEDARLFVDVEDLGEGQVARTRTSPAEMLGEIVARTPARRSGRSTSRRWEGRTAARPSP